MAYFSIISSIADFGFNRFLIREVVQDKSAAPKLLWNIIILRLTLTAVLFAGFAIFLYFLDPDKLRVSLTLLATLAILPQAVALTFDGIFAASKKLQFSAISLFISSVSTIFAGIFLLNEGLGVWGAMDAFIFGQLIYMLVLIIFLHNTQGFLFSPIKLSIIKKALAGSLPYGLLSILGLLYFRIDTLMLSYLKGSFETGLYGVAYRFLEAIIFIPSAFAAAFFPAVAKLSDEKGSELKKIYFTSLKMMLILGLVIMMFYILILPIIIKLFLPNYLQAIDVIKILALSIPFIFIATPGVQILLSSDKYLRPVLLFSIFTVIFNIVLNFIFIPIFGVLAAAWITVLSDVLSFVIFFLFIQVKFFKQ